MNPELQDPLRETILALDERNIPDAVLSAAEPVTGDPAFDPDLINRMGEAIDLTPWKFDHPLLERSVRVGLAHIDATFQGDHPKYGVGAYARPEHDSFPPTIVATVDALCHWGQAQKAQRLFGYWLETFVKDDGSIDYYGTSLSEYGQILATTRRIVESSPSGPEFLIRHRNPLESLAGFTRCRIREKGEIQLPSGVPEADEADRDAIYFHNAAWLCRGLTDWSHVLDPYLSEQEQADFMSGEAAALLDQLLAGLREAWNHESSWLSPTLSPGEGDYWTAPKETVTETRIGSYTNYRYWPELLSSGVLPLDLQGRIVQARLEFGGQHLGVTRFEEHLDDWPLMDYLIGLSNLGMRKEFLLSLYGHIRYHQAEGHLTAYEQVSFPPGKRIADYCLPCQLVAVRAVPLLR